MAGAETRSLERRFRSRYFIMDFGTLIAFLVMCAVFAILRPAFLSFGNFMQILRQVSMLAIMASGMTLIMASGGIDLSIGEAADIGGLVAVSLLVAGAGVVPAVALGILGGASLGLVNGVLISVFRITPYLATLGTHIMVMSLEMAYTKGGLPIYLFPAPRAFSFLGRGFIGSIPFPVAILAVVILVYYLLTTRTVMGRYVYASGANQQASELAGVNVKKVRILTYVLSSGTAALAGIILASRVSSGQPLAGEAYLLDCIAAVFMGMNLSREGKVGILGTLLGAVFFGVVQNGMILLNVVYYMQTLIKAVLLLFVLSLASYVRSLKN